LTPDPLDDASDYTISKPADQGSRARHLIRMLLFAIDPRSLAQAQFVFNKLSRDQGSRWMEANLSTLTRKD